MYRGNLPPFGAKKMCNTERITPEMYQDIIVSWKTRISSDAPSPLFTHAHTHTHTHACPLSEMKKMSNTERITAEMFAAMYQDIMQTPEVRELFKRYAGGKAAMGVEEFRTFLKEAQHVCEEERKGVLDEGA